MTHNVVVVCFQIS